MHLMVLGNFTLFLGLTWLIFEVDFVDFMVDFWG